MGQNDMVILYYVKLQKVIYRNKAKSAQQIKNITRLRSNLKPITRECVHVLNYLVK